MAFWPLVARGGRSTWSGWTVSSLVGHEPPGHDTRKPPSRSRLHSPPTTHTHTLPATANSPSHTRALLPYRALLSGTKHTTHTHTHTRLVAARLAATYCFVRACFACEGVCNKKKKNGEKKTSSRINLVGRGGSIQLRPGEPDCPFYVKTGSCKFGKTCKFNHPRVLGGHADKKPSLFPSALFA